MTNHPNQTQKTIHHYRAHKPILALIQNVLHYPLRMGTWTTRILTKKQLLEGKFFTPTSCSTSTASSQKRSNHYGIFNWTTQRNAESKSNLL